MSAYLPIFTRETVAGLDETMRRKAIIYEAMIARFNANEATDAPHFARFIDTLLSVEGEILAALRRHNFQAARVWGENNVEDILSIDLRTMDKKFREGCLK
ncbi:MAG: hypothetical protein EON54_03440 [Alcaligenaceae bacterium]|nr:MAG: hypothetical protein EON54_03440 [Alcaligenaceae bacterium]